MFAFYSPCRLPRHEPIRYMRNCMARPLHIREILESVDLSWWPEFLLNERAPRSPAEAVPHVTAKVDATEHGRS
jgi:hypothetical protein